MGAPERLSQSLRLFSAVDRSEVRRTEVVVLPSLVSFLLEVSFRASVGRWRCRDGLDGLLQG